MKLTLATLAAIALCFASLAARSHMMKARPASEGTPADRVALAAIDGHLRTNLHFLHHAIALRGRRAVR